MLETFLTVLGVYKVYEQWLGHQVHAGKKPEHIAIILDGNRRWASERRLNSWIGHQFGAEKVENLLSWCLALDIKSITVYAFSTENFQRSEMEVDEIMKVIEEKLVELLQSPDIYKHRVRVKAIGRNNLLPKNIQEIVGKVEDATKDYDSHFLNLALAYGGRAEIIDATKKIAQQVKNGELLPSEINELIFEKHLYTAHMPKQDPDIIIRTSGEERLSGFLLYQCAYSELCFQDVYWPSFRRIDLLRAVRTYQRRKRRFGQ